MTMETWGQESDPVLNSVTTAAGELPVAAGWEVGAA
jgi:hypothetical protein